MEQTGKLRIAVLGTSNSVMKNGYTTALSSQCEVIRIVSGRKPVFGVLQALMANLDRLRDCDMIVLDHYINDMAFYADHIPPEIYRRHVLNLYALLAAIGTPVVSLLLPLRDLDPGNAHYRFVREEGLRHGFALIDLNGQGFKWHHFWDRLHLRHHVAYMVGLRLSEILRLSARTQLLSHRRPPALPAPLPYTVIPAAEIARANGLKTQRLTNAILDTDYVDVPVQPIRIPVSDCCSFPVELLSVGLINRGTDHSAARLMAGEQPRCLAMHEVGYFHEYLDPGIQLQGDPMISSNTQAFACRFLFDRRPVLPEGTPKPPARLSEVLLYDGGTVPIRADLPAGLKIAVPGIVDEVTAALDSIDLHELHPERTARAVNTLRDTAVALETHDTALSLQLMRIAAAMRPAGQFLVSKVREYERAGASQSGHPAPADQPKRPPPRMPLKTRLRRKAGRLRQLVIRRLRQT
ncbi:hypothetical protein PY32053_02506 [Paracoccus yeei]|uniref:Uncharacterized protein n=1 Tax=Paracoccus yeei TaxID=147645 RepID=A0A386UMZ3_9RHOB|nr:hypothetical protein [Paracoccus yeei]AYF02103.1 hypothetical protein PY32053_02506 [Paracoccus yeei]